MALALVSAGNSKAAKIAMIAITTNNSISVNPAADAGSEDLPVEPCLRRIEALPGIWSFACPHVVSAARVSENCFGRPLIMVQ